jgi:Zn-dependent M28 family amino/carboxypeptidase
MLGPWSVLWWICTVVFLVLIAVGTYYGITLFTERYSYGADDNASGIAVMMETARRLREKGLNLRIDFISFAAEEKGLFGSTKWVNKHVREIDKERTYVLNLDCVGRGEKFFITEGLGMVFKKHSDPMLVDLLASVFSEMQLPYEECWGGNSDHAEFVNKKFRTCAIFRFNAKKANIAQTILRNLFRIPIKTNVIPDGDWIHTENDTVENIDENKLEETTLVTLKFIEKLDGRIKVESAGTH